MDPEWLHRQCIGLAYPRTHVHAQVAVISLVICSPHLHNAIHGGQGCCPVQGGGGGNGQSIGSTVSDANVHSWLWLPANGSSPLGYFSSITASTYYSFQSAVQGRERVRTLSVQRPQPCTTNPWKEEEKDKLVGDTKERADHANRKTMALLLKPASPTPSNTGSLRSFPRDTERGPKLLRY